MNPESNLNRILFLPLLAISILFLILYLDLSFHSRLAGDDFFYLWLKNNFGAWKGMMYQYDAWSGRWSAHFVGCSLISFWRSPLFLILINCITILLLVLSISALIRRIPVLSESSVGRNKIIAFTILLISSFFFLSYDIGETWFWYIIILTYLWSIIGFLLILNFIISRNSSVINFLLILIPAAYIGGASESYAMIFLLILSGIFVFRVIQFRKFDAMAGKILFALLVLLISFSFSAFAPGTEIRHSLLPHTSTTDKCLVVIKSIGKYFIQYLPAKALLILVFSAPWIFFGHEFLRNTGINTKKIATRITIGYLVLLVIMFLPTAFVMSETGPARALSIVSLLTAVYFATLLGLVGASSKVNMKWIGTFTIGASLVIIIFLSYSIYDQHMVISRFAAGCDERIVLLEKAKQEGFTGVFELNRVPENGMLFWDEVSYDTAHFTNQHLMRGLDLPFLVRLRPE